MNTVDELLKNIVDNNVQDFFTEVNSKDKRILVSLNKQIKSGYFLTQRQGNLLVKILNSYRSVLLSKSFFDVTLLDNPLWGQQFRVITPIKRILLNEKNNKITIEFTYDNDMKKRVYSFLAACHGFSEHVNSSKIEISKNEKNILAIFEHLVDCGFFIEQKLVDLHAKIVKILDPQIDYSDIFSSVNEKTLIKVNQEILPDSENYTAKLLDRQHRYQYKVKQENSENSLIFKLAARPFTNVFVHEDLHSLTDILSTLMKLDRLPALIVFNNREFNECQRYIDLLKIAIDNTGIPSTGIYFRLDNNTDNNKKFNATIAEYGYNLKLDHTTDIVGIASGTLPKFLLKSTWKAKSVISFTNGFKNNKATVYANDIDLVIYYSAHKPFIGDLYELV